MSSRTFMLTLCIILPVSALFPTTLAINQAQSNSVKSVDQRETKETENKKLDFTTQSQDPKAPSKADVQKQKVNTTASDKPKDAKAEAEDLEAQKRKMVLQIIEDTLWQAKETQNPIVKVRVRAIAADTLWNYQQEKAREILIEEYRNISSIKLPLRDDSKPQTFKGRRFEQLKMELKREVLSLISFHDPTLAESLLSEMSDEKKDSNDRENQKKQEMLSVARLMAETNSEISIRIIKESLKTSISDVIAFPLISLRRSAPAEASAIFNEILSGVRSGGDLWEFSKLIPYVLPNEEDHFLGKHYLADPQRSKDVGTFMEYAAVLLVRQFEVPQVTNNSPPDLIQREMYIWRSLLKVFTDILPDKVWVANMRINYLASLLPQRAQDLSKDIEKMPHQDKLKKMIADAESAIGARRDSLFSRAAFEAWNQGDLDQALSLAQKMDNKENMIVDTSIFLSQASTKALNKEGPNTALNWARRIGMPNVHVDTFSRLISALRSAGRKEETSLLLDELLGWLDNYDNNSDKVCGILRFLDNFAIDDLERGFSALGVLVSATNKADLNPSPKPFRTYWYPDFHDFKKSLAPLAKADFERAFQTIQTIKDKEVFLLIQASLCAEYLKTNKQKPALDMKKVTK